MRTTVDLPDLIYRKAKATAALRGVPMKELILRAIEKDLGSDQRPTKRNLSALPLIRLKGGRKLDLSNFDFDDLLA